MEIRKTWFSYIIWGFIALFFIVMLIMLSKSTESLLGIQSIYMAWGMRILLVVLPGVLIYIIHRLVPHKSTVKMNRTLSICVRVLLFLLMITVFFVLRLLLQNHLTDFSAVTDSSFFQAAKIGARGTVLTVTSMNTYQTYIAVLSSVFMFFGNKASVLLAAQIVFQFIALIAIYIAGRNIFSGLYGVIPAWIMAVAPLFVEATLQTDCRNFTLMFMALYLMLLALLTKGEKQGYGRLWFLGYLVGLLCVYWCGFAGFLFMSVVLLLEKDNTTIKTRIINTLIYLFGAVLSFAVFQLLWPESHGLYAFMQMRLQDGLTINHRISSASFYVFFVLMLLMMCYVVAFWFSRNEKGHLFFIPLLSSLIFLIFSDCFLHSADFNEIFLLCISFTVTEMLYLTFTLSEAEVIVQSELEDRDEPASNQEATEEDSDIWNELATEVQSARKERKDKDADSAEQNQSQVPDDVNKDLEVVNSEEAALKEPLVIRVSDILAAGKGTDNQATQPKEADNSASPEPTVNKKDMIENVLPMPKKHVAKVADYSFEPRQEEMHFDVELTDETSDYDV